MATGLGGPVGAHAVSRAMAVFKYELALVPTLPLVMEDENVWVQTNKNKDVTPVPVL